LHHLIFRICACLLQQCLHPRRPFALQPVETLLSRQPGILRRWSYGVEQPAARHSNCSVINYTFKNLLKAHLFIQSNRVSCLVPCHCSDFMDLLRLLTNCRFTTTTTTTTTVVRDLGVWIDRGLSMSTHVTKVKSQGALLCCVNLTASVVQSAGSRLSDW